MDTYPVQTLRFLFADQLSRELSALEDIDKDHDVVLMVEVADEANHVPHHPKKIAFLLSAMRHFADALRGDGFTVDYVELDDDDNTHSFGGELARALERHKPERVVITWPGEYRVLAMIQDWQARFDIEIELREDTRFFCSREAFASWAKDRKVLRMEHFYREMRKTSGYLMEDDQPAGGKWNYDADNRKPAPDDLDPPDPMQFTPDLITGTVIDLVKRRFDNRFGDLDDFWFATTRGDAQRALKSFVKRALPKFGDYQDAMLDGEDYLFHSACSQYMNCGLISPKEACDLAQEAYDQGKAPLNAVEGYVRQILGWREYVRGIYWLKMPEYAQENRLNAKRPLPALYWGQNTKMRCLHQVVDQTRREAHSHHIQRLMVTGNFALLLGVVPEEICAWYLAVYADAFEWVELPNTLGMVMHADGGYLGSKPYAASGNYINKMSNFCRSCYYDVKKKNGEKACPFNYLYWNFMIENRGRFADNPRIGQIYSTLDRMGDDKREAIRCDTERFLRALERGEA
ncbi:MAG: cryptochrome/photolyase family protein [Geminicoccaceae bacterium]